MILYCLPEIYVVQLLQHTEVQWDAGQFVKPKVDITDGVLQLNKPSDEKQAESRMVI